VNAQLRMKSWAPRSLQRFPGRTEISGQGIAFLEYANLPCTFMVVGVPQR
jgi:hypothetical protein